MKYTHIALCPNGFLKNFASAGMIVTISLFGAKEIKAAPYTWSSVSEIVNKNSQFSNYSTSTVDVKGSLSGKSLPSNVKWALLYLVDMGDGLRIAGGLDGIGYVGTGFINARKDTIPKVTGLFEGQNVDYPIGTVYLRFFVDMNGDGFGTYDKATRLFMPGADDVAIIDSINGSDPFRVGQNQFAGNVSAWYVEVQEPTTSALLALDLSVLGGGSNQVTLSIAVSNALSFSINYKNSLTNATWESLGIHSKTGAVTVITDTNNVPHRFYRVVTP